MYGSRMGDKRDIRSVIDQVEQVTSALKRKGGFDQQEGENAAGLVQSLQNQLTELSQILKHQSRDPGSVTTLSAMAMLESNHVSTTLLRDSKVSKQLMDDFV